MSLIEKSTSLMTIVSFYNIHWYSGRETGIPRIERSLMLECTSQGQDVSVDSLKDNLGCRGCVQRQLAKNQMFEKGIVSKDGMIGRRLRKQVIVCSLEHIEKSEIDEATPCMTNLENPRLMDLDYKARG